MLAPFRLCTLRTCVLDSAIRNAIHITFARRGGWLPRELDAPPRTFFHSERPRHSRRLRPGQLSWCCSVYRDRVPRAMRGPGVRARSGARCAARPTVRGASARVYSRHTASLSELLSRPPQPHRYVDRHVTARGGAAPAGHGRWHCRPRVQKGKGKRALPEHLPRCGPS